MTRVGVDYSQGLPGGAALRAAGYTFALRYLGYAGSGRVDLTAAEVADLHANGVGVVPILERDAARALSGYAGGQEDAGIAKAALAGLDWPEDRPVYFAVDFEASAAQMAAIDEYLMGAQGVLGKGRVGVYGSYAVVTHCAASGSAWWSWQCLAWSYGQLFAGRHIYQSRFGFSVNGVGCDEDEANTDDFGQWDAQEAQKEDEMDEAALRAIVRDEMKKAWTAGAPSEFPHYVRLTIDPQPGGFSDAQGNLLPAVRDDALVAQVTGIDQRLKTLESQPSSNSGMVPHTHSISGSTGGVQ